MNKSFKILSLMLCIFICLPHLTANASVNVPINPSVQLSTPLSDIVEVAMGAHHSCAVTTQGGVKCWGIGQLGDGTTTNSITPIDVQGLSNGVKSVALSGSYSCAVMTNGLIKCWGSNLFGGLGDGTTENRLTPVDVIGLPTGAVAVSLSEQSSCALLNNGSVMCWGMNPGSLFGESTSVFSSTVPIAITGLESGVAKLKIGYGFGCVVLTSGAAQCWGSNAYGYLGDGTTDSHRSPVNVLNLSSGVTDIAVGVDHVCAVVNGAAKCWGQNNIGTIGDGTIGNWRTVPTDVIGLSSGVTAISTGRFHTCALLTSGNVKCWGEGGAGGLGSGDTTNSPTPVDVSSLDGSATTIAVGSNAACVVTTATHVKCWGSAQGSYTGQPNYDIATPAEIVLITKELTVNYTTGKPGSFFTFTLLGFLASDTVNVSANGQPMGVNGISGVSSGVFILDTRNASTGGYFVTIGPFTVLIELSDDSPLRTEEPGAINLSLPANSAVEIHSVFLPLTSLSK